MVLDKKRRSKQLFTAGLIAGVFFFIPLFSGFAVEEKGMQAQFRASKIIDEAVMNNQGQEVGEVDDLIMSRSGKIKKVILSVGGFLEIGDRLVAIPFKQLHMGEGGELTYNVTREQIEKHPVFSYKQEGLHDYYYAPFPPPYGHYGIPVPKGYPGYFPYGQPYGPFPRSRHKGEHRREYPSWSWEYFPERIRVSALLDRSALNEDGYEVGELSDLIINQDGKVKEIVLSVGGFLEIEQKLVAIPFKPIKITDLGSVCDITQEQLKDLPAYHYAN